MPDYTDNSFRASIKALEDVVAPALDPSNPLAAEQLRLVSGFLRFFQERRHALAEYERAELAWHVDLLETLAGTLPSSETDLRTVIQEGVATNRAPECRSEGATTAQLTSELATLASVAGWSAWSSSGRARCSTLSVPGSRRSASRRRLTSGRPSSR